jgi:hypothetical protein
MNPNPTRIRVSTSDPRLRDKLQINLTGDVDAVYWYIRFNIPLDEESVNENSMEVTDTDGYIMRTDISYQATMNRIVISPLDTYEENRYYLLKVSRKVRSAKGQNLRTVISILFKLYRGAISEYKILKKDVPVPPSRPRPGNYDDMQKKRQVTHLDNYVENLARPPSARMIQESLGLRLWPGFAGIAAAIVGFFIGSVPTIIGAVVLCIGAMVYIFTSMGTREFRAKAHYNRGVRYFNTMQYARAKEAFNIAVQTDPANELARYAISRTEIYK